MKATFRPLVWSGPSTPEYQRRSRYTFKAAWSATLDLLDRELEHLKATDLVIEADFREQDLRLDGMPRSNARQPIHPGVRVAFDSKHGPLIYSTDSCDFWQHNVRSIALTLKALRDVERYGATKRAEQYTGYRSIGSGIAMPAQVMTREQALMELAKLANWEVLTTSAGPNVIKQAYRAAARRHHPDAGGQRADWDRLETAMRVLNGGRS